MTIEIFMEKADADLQAKKYDEVFNTEHPVIKVKIDHTQAPVYGFRYYNTHLETIENMDEGYIVLDEDWTAEEAAKCGLVQIPEDDEEYEDEPLYICEDCGARVTKSEACCDGEDL